MLLAEPSIEVLPVVEGLDPPWRGLIRRPTRFRTLLGNFVPHPPDPGFALLFIYFYLPEVVFLAMLHDTAATANTGTGQRVEL
jgi:hypothetical protein